MSDQWGVPQPPPGGFGQVPPPQGPYGPNPVPGPYGPPDPQGPYGLVPQQPVTPQNPYGQPPMPFGQPGPPYGFPVPGRPPPAGRGSPKGRFVGVVVLAVIVAASVIFLLAKGSSGGAKTRAESCSSWKNEQDTINGQNPADEADAVNLLDTEVPVMQAIADSAAPGTFKTQMQKTATDFSAFKSYLLANPNVDLGSDVQRPARFVQIIGSTSADVSALDATCRLPVPGASGGTGSGL